MRRGSFYECLLLPPIRTYLHWLIDESEVFMFGWFTRGACTIVRRMSMMAMVGLVGVGCRNNSRRDGRCLKNGRYVSFMQN